MPDNDFFSWIPFCMWSLRPFERCVKYVFANVEEIHLKNLKALNFRQRKSVPKLKMATRSLYFLFPLFSDPHPPPSLHLLTYYILLYHINTNKRRKVHSPISHGSQVCSKKQLLENCNGVHSRGLFKKEKA